VARCDATAAAPAREQAERRRGGVAPGLDTYRLSGMMMYICKGVAPFSTARPPRPCFVDGQVRRPNETAPFSTARPPRPRASRQSVVGAASAQWRAAATPTPKNPRARALAGRASSALRRLSGAPRRRRRQRTPAPLSTGAPLGWDVGLQRDAARGADAARHALARGAASAQWRAAATPTSGRRVAPTTPPADNPRARARAGRASSALRSARSASPELLRELQLGGRDVMKSGGVAPDLDTYRTITQAAHAAGAAARPNSAARSGTAPPA
jgi:hypothetical protein